MTRPSTWALVFILALSACGSVTRVVVLQHPQTKQTVDCKVDPWGSMNRNQQIESCVDAYKKAGYSVVGDSDSK